MIYRIMLLIVLLNSAEAFALTGSEILKKMDKVATYDTAVFDAEMIIKSRDGDKTTMKLISYEKRDGDKSIMIFTHPARLKNTAVLIKGSSIWYYNRRTNRVRLLSKSAKKGSMMGSSFSYDDLSLDYEKDFTSKIIEESSTYYVLRLTPKDEDRKYKYLITTVLKDNFMAVKVEYYSANNVKYKELVSGNIKKIDGHLAALDIKMTDLGTGKETSFRIAEGKVKYNIVLADKVFSERNLKK